MKTHKFQVRYFHCTHCGLNMMFPKKGGRLSKKQHLKTVYCAVCKRKRKFILDEAFLSANI